MPTILSLFCQQIKSFVLFNYSLVGEMSALFDVQRLHTAVAATDVEMFVFKKEDFLDFLSLYPDLKETLEQACVLHYKETIEATAKSVGVKVIVPISNDGNSPSWILV